MGVPFSQSVPGVVVTGIVSTVLGGLIITAITGSGGQQTAPAAASSGPAATVVPPSSIVASTNSLPSPPPPQSAIGAAVPSYAVPNPGTPPAPPLGSSSATRTVAGLAVTIEGQWNGTYSYNIGGSIVPFAAQFQSSNPCIGRSQEPNTVAGRTLNANLTCNVVALSPGQLVTITKQYEAGAGAAYASSILYTGTVSSDGRTINGQWAINGQVGGTFVLRR